MFTLQIIVVGILMNITARTVRGGGGRSVYICTNHLFLATGHSKSERNQVAPWENWWFSNLEESQSTFKTARNPTNFFKVVLYTWLVAYSWGQCNTLSHLPCVAHWFRRVTVIIFLLWIHLLIYFSLWMIFSSSHQFCWDQYLLEYMLFNQWCIYPA